MRRVFVVVLYHFLVVRLSVSALSVTTVTSSVIYLFFSLRAKRLCKYFRGAATRNVLTTDRTSVLVRVAVVAHHSVRRLTKVTLLNGVKYCNMSPTVVLSASSP